MAQRKAGGPASAREPKQEVGAPTYFATPADFRAWLDANHVEAAVLWVGYYKKGTGRPSITWPESVDQALCFGWIDGVRHSLGDDSYVIRFTPRRPGSTWSTVNIRRAGELVQQGLMAPAGLRAFEARDESKTQRYSFEREAAALPAEYEREFRRDERAWEFFERQPPGYRKIAAWYVMSARQDATRQRRLARLIAASAAGARIDDITARANRPAAPE